MVLTGDGGDQVLSGYNSYTGIKISSMISTLPPFLEKMIPSTLNLIAQPIGGNLRYRLNKAQNIFEAAGLPFGERFLKKNVTSPCL